MLLKKAADVLAGGTARRKVAPGSTPVWYSEDTQMLKATVDPLEQILVDPFIRKIPTGCPCRLSKWSKHFCRLVFSIFIWKRDMSCTHKNRTNVPLSHAVCLSVPASLKYLI